MTNKTKEQEFNLSEKIQKARRIDLKKKQYDVLIDCYWDEDVKEFIKILKEKAKEYEWEGEEIIDKLAGDKLTKELKLDEEIEYNDLSDANIESQFEKLNGE